MGYKKTKRFIRIISLVFFFGVIGIIISLNSVDKLTTQNTKEFDAVIEKIELTDTGESLYITIYTKEPDKQLNLSTSVSKKISKSKIESLHKGDIVFFRIENDMINQFENSGFGNIVSLKTPEKEILSLDDYNKLIHEPVSIARKACIVVALVFLSICVANTDIRKPNQLKNKHGKL